MFFICLLPDGKRPPEPNRGHDATSQGRSRERPDHPGLPEGPASFSDRDNSSDELNSKFRSQCLHSSSSSSSSSSAYEMAHGPMSPDSAIRITPKSSLLSRSPSTNNAPQALGHQSGTSMTLPKVRTPLTPRDSIQLVKKHYSQPQPSLDRLHHLNVNIDIMSPSSTSSTLKSVGTSTSPFSQVVEETDIDSMDGVEEGPETEEPSQDGVSFVGLAEELERQDPEALKPPTPPLHRFPSWVCENRNCIIASWPNHSTVFSCCNSKPAKTC